MAQTSVVEGTGAAVRWEQVASLEGQPAEKNRSQDAWVQGHLECGPGPSLSSHGFRQ